MSIEQEKSDSRTEANFSPPDQTVITSQLKAGDDLYDKGNFEKAFQIYTKLLNDISSSGVDSSFNVLLITLNKKLGITSLKRAKYSDAYTFLTKAQELNSSLNNNDPLEGELINMHLGELSLIQGKFIEAKEKLKKCLETLLINYKQEEKEIINCYNALAELCNRSGRYRDALANLEKATQMDFTTKDVRVQLAISYHLMGKVFYYLADHHKALEFIQKSLNIEEELYGFQNHPDIAKCYNTIGHVCLAQSKYSDALQNYNIALKIRLEFLSENHPDVAASYNNIGIIQKRLGDYYEALKYYKKCLSIETICFGENHPEVATTYTNIANILYEQDQINQALEYYQKALEIRLRIYGENHPDVASSYFDIGDVYRYQYDYEKSQVSLLKALNIRLKYLGDKHPEIANAYNALGLLYYDKREYSSSLASYLKSLRIWMSSKTNGLAETSGCFCNLSFLFDDNRDFELAEACLKKSNQIDKAILGPGHQNLRDFVVQISNAEKRKYLLDLNNSGFNG